MSTMRFSSSAVVPIEETMQHAALGSCRVDDGGWLDATVANVDVVQRFTDAYRVELSAWIASVQAGRAIGPSAWDGHRANLVAAAGVVVPVEKVQQRDVETWGRAIAEVLDDAAAAFARAASLRTKLQ